MIDAKILPLQKAALQPIAAFLAHRGVRADQISLVGFMGGLGAFAALCLGYFWVALLLILVNRALDGLDGAVARLHGPTDRGAYLDIALDMVFYALIPLGFAVAVPEINALPAAVLIVSFVGTGSSFLAFSAVAAKLGREAPEFPTKGIYYAGGLAEGFETIAVFIVMCLLPWHFPLIAYGFAALCGVTTVIRWRQGWVAFSGDDQ
ncbi:MULTISPECIES: CDP-alcohol phosphatidyltransferase family protein [unclassified Rhizobium]|jgi:phosphatidylglycerophosphate synthase|uniref:CDP-alcohol phosphatidyltransferase family protein n=1 Tax=unclassified Rhizobium TaxID=2613769 RepID=UPI001AE4728C|nr:MULTISPECIES: CDP-alcohol phosphatidyltransferase family protein [unclassified Rhizobium]MBP2460072.1 phosphatidylglycerophosphate synthase [Rhizobium sp. PvP014]MBP2531431.1 phosphatidylglycerophosphate synthase [Rhizobium sp. PvP099]